MIHFNCGHCGKTLRVGGDSAGKRGKCPGCQEPCMVPAAGGPPPRPGAPSAPAPPPRPSRPAAPAIYAPAMGLREAAPSPTPAPATRHAQDSYADVPQARFSYSGARRAKSCDCRRRTSPEQVMVHTTRPAMKRASVRTLVPAPTQSIGPGVKHATFVAESSSPSTAKQNARRTGR